MVYGVDCSASGEEEATSCDGVSYLEGKEVWMRIGLPVAEYKRSRLGAKAAVNKLGAVPVDAPRHRQTRVLW